MAVPLERKRKRKRKRLRASGRSCLRDPETEIGWWSGYRDEPARQPPLRPLPPIGTFVRDVPQVGRNEPCPCGSGRKYKKRHGAG